MDENTQTGQETPSGPVEIPKDPEAYAEWRQSGALPEAKGKSASGDAKYSDSDSASKEPGQKSAPASEAGKKETQETKHRSSAQTRLDEILADLKKAGLSPAELKTYKREVQNQEKAQPETTVKPPERPKRPKYDDFETNDAYEAAMDKYEEDLAEFKSNQAIEKFKQTQAQETSTRELTAKLADAKQRYGVEAQGVITKTVGEILGDSKIPGAIKAVLEESPVLVDLLYVIGSDSAEFTALLEQCRTHPGQAIRKISLIEHYVMEELSKGTGKGKEEKRADEAGEESGNTAPERDETGKFVSRKVSKAPPPPDEVGGSKGSPPDETESAFKANDFRKFREAENRKDLARMRG